MSMGEDWCCGFYTPDDSYKFHARTVYVHAAFTVPPVGGTFGIQSNICSGAFLQK